MKISSAVLAILVLQAVLVSAAMAESNGVGASAAAKKKCCGFCNSWSGVYTCDDLLTKCGAPTCQRCQAVPTDKGTRYMCRDTLPAGCPCKAN